MKLKRSIKILLGVYIGTILFASILANRMQKLALREDLKNRNENIVLQTFSSAKR